MYIQEVSIQIKSGIDSDEVLDAFDSLMSSYRQSGQTQGKTQSQFINDGKITAMPYTHEKDALSSRHNNFYVSKKILQIGELCGSKLEFLTLGKDYPGHNYSCTCRKPRFYILFTNYLTIASPVSCGTCGKPVPLYKLPVYDDHGYVPVLNWESNYIACDTLQMNCKVGEQWATRQMQELNSQLSQQGLRICGQIKGQTGIPVYYYLFNYRRKKKNGHEKPCPGCGKRWDLKNQLHDLYDFKCDDCLLLSNMTFNS